MSLHRRELILRALETLLTGQKLTGAHVYRNRVSAQAAENLPSLNIMQGPDVPVDDLSGQAVLPYIDRELSVGIEIRVRETDGDAMEQHINEIAREVTVAMHADYTLGLAYVHQVIEDETSAPAIEDEDALHAVVTQAWRVRYRTSRTDPSA